MKKHGPDVYDLVKKEVHGHELTKNSLAQLRTNDTSQKPSLPSIKSSNFSHHSRRSPVIVGLSIRRGRVSIGILVGGVGIGSRGRGWRRGGGGGTDDRRLRHLRNELLRLAILHAVEAGGGGGSATWGAARRATSHAEGGAARSAAIESTTPTAIEAAATT